MKLLDEATVDHLRRVSDLPDLSDTPYRLPEPIARGGMGTIYAAVDERLGRSVALKVLSLADPRGIHRRRMLREARIVARLEHPSNVPIHDVGVLPDGRPFYAMKLVRGDRLSVWAASERSRQDRLRLFLRICDGVSFAHIAGVIHRDLKPENIMVGPFGEVLVMDWGAAIEIGAQGEDGPDNGVEGADAEMEPDGMILGTPAYMAPELARGEPDPVGTAGDIYALAAILYVLLVGRPPYAAESVAELRRMMEAAPPIPPRRLLPDIPRPLEAICLKGLSATPGERYPSVDDLARDVSRFLDGAPVAAYRDNALERVLRWGGRNRYLLLLVGAYLLMRAVVFLLTRRP